MEPGLHALLEKNGVSNQVSEWLAAPDQACTSVGIFANWCDSRSEVNERILRHTALRDNLGQLARLKQAWREADAQVARGVRRSAEGLPDVAIDEPLGAEAQLQITEAFLKFYSWPRLDARRMGSDALLGRFRREFDRRQPSMYHIPRARSLTASQRSAPIKRSRLSDGLVLESRDIEGEDRFEAAGLWPYFDAFDVVVTTWAVAGCFDIEYEGKNVRYAHWESVASYLFDVRHHAVEAMESYQEASVRLFVSSVEEEIRGYAIEMARRAAPVPWGLALALAAAQHSHLWQERRCLLQPRGSAQRQRSRTPPVRKARQRSRTPRKERPGKGAEKGASKGAPQLQGRADGAPAARSKWMTSDKDAEGWPLCKRWNDKRGCTGQCNGRSTHACDIMLEKTMKACGSTKHNRVSHDPRVHGAPALLNARRR